jgi:uncharacterized coiled-coil protein SlyX
VSERHCEKRIRELVLELSEQQAVLQGVNS